MQKNKLTKYRFIILLIVVGIASGLMGFFVAKTSSHKIIDNLETNNNQNRVRGLQNANLFYQELLSQEKGKYLVGHEEVFDPKKMHFDSPLFREKMVDVSIFSYKGDQIVERSINLGNGIYIYFAEYVPIASAKKVLMIQNFPANFVTFAGNENYELYPMHVGPRVMRWDDDVKYTRPEDHNQQQQDYYFELPTRQNTSLSLSTYISYFNAIKENTNPVLLSLSKDHFLSKDIDDPTYYLIKEELKAVADTITYGIPQ